MKNRKTDICHESQKNKKNMLKIETMPTSVEEN